MKLAGISFAKNPLSKNPSKGCGSCLEVRCTDQFCSSTAPLTVLVYDDCDECDANQVNLQALPFATFARPELGRINVEWRQVPCAYDGNIVVGVDKFRASDGGWVRLVFKRVNGGSVEKAEIAKAGSGSFVAMKNSFGAVWEASNLPELPWDIRLTVADGKSIVLRNALTSPNTGDAETKGNF